MPRLSVEIDSETYYKLRKIAESRGETLYGFVKKLLKQVASSSSTNTLSERISDILQTGVATPIRSSSETASTTPSTQPNADSSVSQNKTVVKCFPKAKMKYPLESYINFYNHKGILVDWQEEGDRICFKLL
jgi:K+-sensing histidine kinase KdpD